jgi:glutathione S-transferase
MGGVMCGADARADRGYARRTREGTRMKLYYHPLSSYSQKVLVALHEKNVDPERVIIDFSQAGARDELQKVNRLGKLPVLVIEEKSWRVPESTIIVEYLEQHFRGGTKLIPDDPELARQVRFRDRIFDNYVAEPTLKVLFDRRRPEGKRDELGVKDAHDRLDKTLALLDDVLGKSTWAFGDAFTLADCAAAPALNYTAMVHPLDAYKNVVAYLGRLRERASVARVFEEAKPYLARVTTKI